MGTTVLLPHLLLQLFNSSQSHLLPILLPFHQTRFSKLYLKQLNAICI